MSAPPPVEPMPLPEAEGWWDYWATTSGDERRAAITLRREYQRLRGIAEAATAYVAHENNGRTRDSAWCARKNDLFDALARAIDTTKHEHDNGGTHDG